MSTWHDPQKLDALAELLNIGMGRAAASLSELVGKRVELSIPQVSVCRGAECQELLRSLGPEPETVISQAFQGTLQGSTSLCFSKASSVSLAEVLSGSSHGAAELDAELSGILLEVGNIMINGVMGALSNAISAVLNYSMPELQTTHRPGKGGPLDFSMDKDVLVGDVRFQIMQHDIQGSMIIVFTIGTLDSMLDSLLETVTA